MSDEKKEVIEHESGEVAELTPLSMIAQVIENPDFDVQKLEKMMDLQERWEDRQAEREFNEAMSAFQADVPAIQKNRKGAHDIMYAPLDTIMQTIQPVLSEHGLSVSFSTDLPNDGLIRAVCTVSHRAGHSRSSEISIPVDDKMVANASQRMGSANAYAKRYALGNALNLAFLENDTDAGNLHERISVDQQTIINDLIDECGVDNIWIGKFLKWLDAKSVEDIPLRKFKDAEAHLKKIRDENS